MHEWQDCCEVSEACQEKYLGQDDVKSLSKYSILLCGTSLAKDHFKICRSDVDFHVLLYSIKGQGKLLTPDKTQIMEPNTLTILPAKTLSGFTLDAEEWETAWFILDNDEMWQGLSLTQPEINYNEHALGIYHAINMFICEAKMTPGGNQTTAACLELILQLVQKSLFKAPQASINGAQIKLRHLFSEVEQQLQHPWTVAELAAKLHYSEPHFFRLCLKHLGVSPKQYLLNLKMTRAKHLLVTQHWGVGQVALALGYYDVANFSNRFKKFYGVSPSAAKTAMFETS